ncbi:unnamed protein product [Sphenostylis stenocarpa]|uniref:Dynein light chain n=1 Tax=Sphenostylis stenocarpa TaxID=92480 RepID=A0AA86SKI8_9FABA|nr:unnamed protein product [Sphenostylis stenocarpa]
MSEEAKRNIAGPLPARPITDDRKPSPLPAPAVPPKKVIIKSADMIPDMQKEAVDIAVAAFEKYNVEKDVAEQIKKEFDKRHGPTWHCIVGRNFDFEAFFSALLSSGKLGVVNRDYGVKLEENGPKKGLRGCMEEEINWQQARRERERSIGKGNNRIVRWQWENGRGGCGSHARGER